MAKSLPILHAVSHLHAYLKLHSSLLGLGRLAMWLCSPLYHFIVVNQKWQNNKSSPECKATVSQVQWISYEPIRCEVRSFEQQQWYNLRAILRPLSHLLFLLSEIIAVHIPPEHRAVKKRFSDTSSHDPHHESCRVL